MERIERITPRGHRVVVFNPRKYCKRTLFNRVLKELKTKEIKINYFRVCVLGEFKEKYKTDFKNKGYLYHYRWVKTCHPKIKLNSFFKSKYSFGDVNFRTIVNENVGNPYRDEILNDWLKNFSYKLSKRVVECDDKYKPSALVIDVELKSRNEKSDTILETFIDKCEVDYWKTLDNDLNRDELNTLIHYSISKGYLRSFKDYYSKETFTKKPSGVHTIRIRLKSGTMDLTKYQTPFYSPLNLKYWDKNGKTSNKGLKAIYPYKWDDGTNCGGWVFGGIKVDDLHEKCKLNLMPNYNKKMKYGEMAMWWYKGLM